MILRATAWAWLLALPGCIAPRLVVEQTTTKSTATAQAKPPTRFQEYRPTTPGEYVLKNPPAETPMEPAAIWPATTQPAVHVQPVNTLLKPTLPPAGEHPLVGAVRLYLDGHTDKAIERIKDLDTSNQELILRLLPALMQAWKGDYSGRTPGDAAVLASQLDAASDAVAKVAPLKIRKTCFVWRVSQFGVYDPVPEKHAFLPGGAGVLYLELQNAPSVPADLPAGGKGYVTRLACSHCLADGEGRPLGAARKFDHAEFSRSPVKDFFLKIEFDVPQQPGVYSLVVDVIDPATKRKARQQIELKVGG